MIDLTDESDIWIQKISDVPLGYALSVDWQHQLRLRNESLALPAEFVSSLIQICIAEEPMQHNFVAVSFLELALWIVQILNAQFPVERTKDGQWICKTAQDLFLRPTLAFVAQKVRQGLTRGLKALGLTDYLCVGLNRQCAGIVVPVDGVVISIPPSVAADMSRNCSDFFPHQMRKAADVARPIA